MWVSGAVRRALGLEPEDLVGMSAFDIVHPDDHADVVDASVQPGRAGRSRHRPLRSNCGCGAPTARISWFEAAGSNQLADPSIRGLSSACATSPTDARRKRRCASRRNATAASSRPRPTRSSRSISTGMIQSFNHAAEFIFATPRRRRRSVSATRSSSRRSRLADRPARTRGRSVGQQIDTIARRAVRRAVRGARRRLRRAGRRDALLHRGRARHQRPARDGTGAAHRRIVRRPHGAPQSAHAARPRAGRDRGRAAHRRRRRHGVRRPRPVQARERRARSRRRRQLLVLVADRIADAIREQDVVARLGQRRVRRALPERVRPRSDQGRRDCASSTR